MSSTVLPEIGRRRLRAPAGADTATAAPLRTLVPQAPSRTAWMGQPCRQNCMAAASMQFELADRAAG